MRLRYLLMVAGIALAMGCSGTDADNNGANNGANNGGGKGDQSATWLEEQLGDRQDPIAQYLREVSDVDDDGEFTGSYRDIQFDIAGLQGCETSSASNYIISDALLTGSDPFPRLVSTVCADTAEKRWQFFMSPPSSNQRDIDVHTIEMFAWDAETTQFNFYKVHPVDRDQDRVFMEVGPAECADCHLGPRGVDASHMPMLPVMNELTQPWEHWNAEPGFDSQAFDVPEDVKQKEHYAELAGDSWKGSASTLEQTIRSAQQQVAQERVFSRRAPAPGSVSETMGLLRPLFCDEQVNYVSEPGTSGQLLLSAVIDQGLVDVIKSIEATGWGQKWMGTDSRLRLGEPGNDDPVISMLPVRGHANRVYERLMVNAARGIPSETALQVHLLDWQTPVFSETRCGLWVDANERLEREPLDVNLDEMRNYELIPILLEEIMQVDGISLMTGEEGKYYMLADGAKLEDLTATIDAGDVAAASCEGGTCACPGGACIADLNTMVDVIEEYVVGFEEAEDARSKMWEVRQERACTAITCYDNRPFIPEIDEGSCGPCPFEGLAAQ